MVKVVQNWLLDSDYALLKVLGRSYLARDGYIRQSFGIVKPILLGCMEPKTLHVKSRKLA
jgi:hypothetical protein